MEWKKAARVSLGKTVQYCSRIHSFVGLSALLLLMDEFSSGSECFVEHCGVRISESLESLSLVGHYKGTFNFIRASTYDWLFSTAFISSPAHTQLTGFSIDFPPSGARGYS